MHNIILIILFLSNYIMAKEDFTKEAIAKLIDRSYKLEKRVSELEIMLNKISHNSVDVPVKKITNIASHALERPIYFSPSGTSHIRVSPHASSKLSGVQGKRKYYYATKGNKYTIYKIACNYRDMFYWGKSDKGWIYLSNPRYGKLLDENNKLLPYQFHYWCKGK